MKHSKRTVVVAVALVAVLVGGWFVATRLVSGTQTSSTGYVADPEPHRAVAFTELTGKSLPQVYQEIGYPDFTRDKYVVHVVPLDPSAENIDAGDQVVAAVCGSYFGTGPTDIWFGVYSKSALSPELGDRIRDHDKCLDAELMRAAPSCPVAASGMSGPAQQ